MEEFNREMRNFGVVVPGGVEHMELRARTLHEAGNWLVVDDCSKAFNTVKRTAVLRRWPTACQSSRRYWPSAMAQDQLACFTDGLRGDQDDYLLQRCPARGPHGSGNVLPGVATGAGPLQR